MSLTSDQLTLTRMAIADGVFNCMLVGGTPTGEGPFYGLPPSDKFPTLSPMVNAIAPTALIPILTTYKTAKISLLQAHANKIATDINAQISSLNALNPATPSS